VLVVATKLDATTDTMHLEELRKYAAKRDLPFFSVSAASGAGIAELVRAMADELDRLPRLAVPASKAEAGLGAEPAADDTSRGAIDDVIDGVIDEDEEWPEDDAERGRDTGYSPEKS
jgi:50S ribosomal subunit-associated GTPase HflX